MQIGINKNKLQKLSQMSFLLKFYPAKLSSYTLPSQHATMHSVLMWATKVNYKLITYGSFYAIQVVLVLFVILPIPYKYYIILAAQI